jgi:Spy/CpxP family protein refolding chaperone
MNESSAKLRAALWVGAVFLLGAALGGVLGYLFAHKPVSAANSPQSEPDRRARRVAEITSLLSLTPQQSQQLDAILKSTHAEIKGIRQQSDAQLEQALAQERQKGRTAVRAILTPEQMPKYEEFLKRVDEERKHNPPPLR